MMIYVRSMSCAAAALFVAGCGVTLQNQTPATLVRNASGIYPITATVKKQSNAILDKSIRTELVVWGEAAQMGRLPAAEATGTSQWAFSLAVPPKFNEVHYYFRVHYQAAKSLTDFNQKQAAFPPGAPDKLYVLRLLDRVSTGLDSERGRVGSTISLLGKGFTPDDQVSIGGQVVKTIYKDSSVLKFQIPPLAANQAYALEVIGPAGDPVKVGPKLLVDPSDFAVSPAPAVLVLGAKATLAIRLPQPAPAGGLSVALKLSDPALANLPASVTLKEGDSEAILNTSGQTAGSGTVTLEATGFNPATVPLSVVEVK